MIDIEDTHPDARFKVLFFYQHDEHVQHYAHIRGHLYDYRQHLLDVVLDMLPATDDPIN